MRTKKCEVRGERREKSCGHFWGTADLSYTSTFPPDLSPPSRFGNSYRQGRSNVTVIAIAIIRATS